MACAHPITISSKAGNMSVACKQCLPCRISKQSALSLRCLLECRTTTSAQFWTLTYADAPAIGTLKDGQAFLKRLRTWNLRQGNPNPIRYLLCGEYGSKSGRFHYHALIYNSFPVPERYRTSLWPQGFVYIGEVTPASIRYTARYTLKFYDKGQEAVASWSKGRVHLDPLKSSLPLGGDGMLELALYMKNNNYRATEPPKALRIEGKNYAVDRAMQNVFGLTFFGADFLTMSVSAAAANLRYLIDRKLGDPVAAQRLVNEEKQRFYESARFINETF